MGRTVSADLQNLLDLDACETQTTLDIVPVTADPLYLATKELTANSEDYTDDLRSTGEVKQSIFAPPDRVNAVIQNVDKVFGGVVTAEDLVKAEAIVGRYFSDPRQPALLPSVWVELFRGEMKPTDLNEGASTNEILNDMAAAGYCIAHWTLAENCQNVFKHAGTCGYAGAATTCSKRRKSLDGCAGRTTSGVTNENRFNGMEFPEPQVPELPSGDGWGPPIWPHCPRLDQFVLVRAHWTTEPRPKRVEMLGSEDELYDPVTGEFVSIGSIAIVHDQPIWELVTAGGGRGYSSSSHPIIRDVIDRKGRAIKKLKSGDGVLTWSKGSFGDDTATTALAIGEPGSVAKIELVTGHIYAYSDRAAGPFIVCHNSKPPPE